MNLMTQVVENIYKNGNAILHLNEKPNWKIIFYVGEDNKLNIKIEIDYGYDLVETFNLNAKKGLAHIALLVYYSFNNYARKKDLVYLTCDNKDINSQSTMIAINELYQQLMSIISTEKKHIESLAKSNYTYETFANLSEYVDSTYKMLSIKDIMKSLVNKYKEFEETLSEANLLWRKTGEGSVKETYNAINNWNDFLNQLYIALFSDSSKVDLNNIDIDYEFLTSKSYISDPAIDREKEIENLEIALLTPSKSAMLIGPPGVGKTAVTEGLAYRISTGNVSPALQNKKILKINTSSIVRGCKYVGMFEEKVETIMRYLTENPDTILFIDEIHTAIGAGLGSKGNLDLANIMKPYIDRGQKVIGATTEDEYEEYIKNDKAFNRRFQKVTISEPEKNAVCQIIQETIRKLEKTTNIKWDFDTNISEMIINHIVECTGEKNRVYNDKIYNPDISITILENSFAIALLRGLDSVSVENVSDAIRRSEFLYESVRIDLADKLLSKYKLANFNGHSAYTRCKIIPISNLKK